MTWVTRLPREQERAVPGRTRTQIEVFESSETGIADRAALDTPDDF